MKTREIGGTAVIASTLLLYGAAVQAGSATDGNQMVIAADEHSTSIGEKIDDSVITTKVKAELLKPDNGVSGLAINVTTTNGEVQLSGFVDSTEQAQTAARIAQEVGGVISVRNDLQVKSQ